MKTLYSLKVLHSSDSPAACLHGPNLSGGSVSVGEPKDIHCGSGREEGVMFQLNMCYYCYAQIPVCWEERPASPNLDSEMLRVTCEIISAHSKGRSS